MLYLFPYPMDGPCGRYCNSWTHGLEPLKSAHVFFLHFCENWRHDICHTIHPQHIANNVTVECSINYSFQGCIIRRIHCTALVVLLGYIFPHLREEKNYSLTCKNTQSVASFTEVTGSLTITAAGSGFYTEKETHKLV